MALDRLQIDYTQGIIRGERVFLGKKVHTCFVSGTVSGMFAGPGSMKGFGGKHCGSRFFGFGDWGFGFLSGMFPGMFGLCQTCLRAFIPILGSFTGGLHSRSTKLYVIYTVGIYRAAHIDVGLFLELPSGPAVCITNFRNIGSAL